MKFNELNLSNHKNKTRVGRGISAGKGKTAGRGTKGQGARTGSSRRPGFEGGQNPLMQRLPKLHGFHSHKPKTINVYTGQLNTMGGKVITNASLVEEGIIEDGFASVKLIVRGELTKKLEVKLQGVSTAAKEMIQKAGGSFELVPRPSRPNKETAKA